jgi:spore coat polysaccharide biosynthesis protein SpsF
LIHLPNRILTIVQARMGSSRLPGKVLLPLAGKPLLYRMVERVRRSRLCGQVVVAMTTDAEDDMLEELCQQEGMDYFRGHPLDLLDRHYQTATRYQADIVLKIPSDCPLIDPQVIDRVIQFYLDHEGQYDFVSNLHPATYPDGNDVEIMTLNALKAAWKNAGKPLEREHTTPYIWDNTDLFRVANVAWETGKDYSMTQRWTIDYPEDYHFIRAVYNELFTSNPDFGLNEILELMRKREDIFRLNSHLAGVNWYRNHLDELKTVDASQTKLKD